MDYWRTEFGGGYAVPPEITAAGLVDCSWHNDVCPSFCLPEQADHEGAVRLWVDHPDPDQRERGSDAPRYLVSDGAGGDEFYEGENVHDALAALRAQATP